jgi:hypothetical protein
MLRAVRSRGYAAEQGDEDYGRRVVAEGVEAVGRRESIMKLQRDGIL